MKKMTSADAGLAPTLVILAALPSLVTLPPGVAAVASVTEAVVRVVPWVWHVTCDNLSQV